MREQTEPGFQQRPFGLGGRLDIAVKSNPLAFRTGPRSHNRKVDRPEVFPARQPVSAADPEMMTPCLDANCGEKPTRLTVFTRQAWHNSIPSYWNSCSRDTLTLPGQSR